MKVEKIPLKSDIGTGQPRLSVDDIRNAFKSPEYNTMFEDSVFTGYLLSKLNSRKEGITLGSFKAYLPIIRDFTHFACLTPTFLVKNAYPIDARLDWKLKCERWFSLMVGQVAPRGDLELDVGRYSWNVALKRLVMVDEFFRLNNIDLGVNIPASANPEHRAFVPSKELIREALEICDDPILASYILVAKDSALSPVDLIGHDVASEYYDGRQQVKYESVISQYRRGLVPIVIVGKRTKTARAGLPFMAFLGEEVIDFFNKKGGFPYFGNRLVGFKSTRIIQKKFQRLARELKQPLFVPKSLRAFTSTAIRSADLSETKSKIIVGHQIDDVEKYYVNFQVDVLSKAYMSAYDYLRVLN